MSAAYNPPAGTIPAKVLAHLRSLPAGTRLRSAELIGALGLEIGASACLSNYLVTAVQQGAIVQHPDPLDKRRSLWWLGDGTPPERQQIEGEDADDAPLERRPQKAAQPDAPRIDQLVAAKPAKAPKSRGRVLAKKETLCSTEPAPGQVSTELGTTQQVQAEPAAAIEKAAPPADEPKAEIIACCRQFDSCTRACTPRGIHIGRKSMPPDLFDVAGYERLASVLVRAHEQAAAGKGAQRHAQGQPFHAQPMQQLIKLYGIGFALGQAAKKAQEAQRLPTVERQVAELLGAINYLAGAVIALENSPTPESPK